jgi:CSLREA domain-containing protein
MRNRALRRATALAFVVGIATGARGTTIPVDATADSLAVDGNCTLREAIIAANTDTAVDACPAGSGADVVVVPAGTYTLTLTGADEDAAASGDLDITGDLELSGAGAAVTIIDGNFTDRVLDVDPGGAGLTVRVSGVTLQHGGPAVIGAFDAGAGVRSRATLTLADCVVRENNVVVGPPTPVPMGRGGGIASDGSLRVERCVIRDNRIEAYGASQFQPFASASGGGIDGGSGPVVVVDSTIATNEAGAIWGSTNGGGIAGLDVTLIGSTVNTNDASGGNPVAGGGLSVQNATIRNSTVSGNDGGGITVKGGTVTLSNATVAGNGRGIEAGGAVTLVLRNTIVAGNLLEDCAGSPFGSFVTVGDAYNLDSDRTCMLSGTDQSGVDPRLAPLADNGGPTFTHALLARSPAIDAGNPAAPGSGGTACEPTDQRGVGRPVGPRCDIGAFEGALTTICSPAPQGRCQPALSEKSKLSLKNSPDDRKNRLTWLWTSSASVELFDFQDPVSGANDYALCLYDQSGRRLAAAAPAGGLCPTKPCWKQTSSGFSYTDKQLDPDSLKKVVLKEGPTGKAKITVKGAGANLDMPALPLAAPVLVQLVRLGAGPACWEATFSTSTRNDAEVFRARSDP